MRFMHTWYWDKTKQVETKPDKKGKKFNSIEKLQEAMDLDSLKWLKKLLKEIPAYSLID